MTPVRSQTQSGWRPPTAPGWSPRHTYMPPTAAHTWPTQRQPGWPSQAVFQWPPPSPHHALTTADQPFRSSQTTAGAVHWADRKNPSHDRPTAKTGFDRQQNRPRRGKASNLAQRFSQLEQAVQALNARMARLELGAIDTEPVGDQCETADDTCHSLTIPDVILNADTGDDDSVDPGSQDAFLAALRIASDDCSETGSNRFTSRKCSKHPDEDTTFPSQRVTAAHQLTTTDSHMPAAGQEPMNRAPLINRRPSKGQLGCFLMVLAVLSLIIFAACLLRVAALTTSSTTFGLCGGSRVASPSLPDWAHNSTVLDQPVGEKFARTRPMHALVYIHRVTPPMVQLKNRQVLPTRTSSPPARRPPPYPGEGSKKSSTKDHSNDDLQAPGPSVRPNYCTYKCTYADDSRGRARLSARI